MLRKSIRKRRINFKLVVVAVFTFSFSSPCQPGVRQTLQCEIYRLQVSRRPSSDSHVLGPGTKNDDDDEDAEESWYTGMRVAADRAPDGLLALPAVAPPSLPSSSRQHHPAAPLHTVPRSLRLSV